MENVTNTLNAIEKAVAKIAVAKKAYSAIFENPYREADPPKGYFKKIVEIEGRLEKEHEAILSSLWEKGIFFA